MDIKLGKKNRLRLDEGDCQLLQNGLALKRSFEVTPDLRIEVNVVMSSPEETSDLQSTGNRITLFLSPEDLTALSEGNLKREGLWVGSYQVQVDLWESERRSRLENKRRYGTH